MPTYLTSLVALITDAEADQLRRHDAKLKELAATRDSYTGREPSHAFKRLMQEVADHPTPENFQELKTQVENGGSRRSPDKEQADNWRTLRKGAEALMMRYFFDKVAPLLTAIYVRGLRFCEEALKKVRAREAELIAVMEKEKEFLDFHLTRMKPPQLLPTNLETTVRHIEDLAKVISDRQSMLARYGKVLPPVFEFVAVFGLSADFSRPGTEAPVPEPASEAEGTTAGPRLRMSKA